MHRGVLTLKPTESRVPSFSREMDLYITVEQTELTLKSDRPRRCSAVQTKRKKSREGHTCPVVQRPMVLRINLKRFRFRDASEEHLHGEFLRRISAIHTAKVRVAFEAFGNHIKGKKGMNNERSDSFRTFGVHSRQFATFPKTMALNIVY